jgi:acetolactate synthase-1/2/3 large subunit
MVPHLVPVTCEVVGDPVASLLRLGEIRPDRSDWSCEEVHLLVATQRAKMRPSPNGSVPALLPHRVVDQVIGRYRGARITVDAGAHMFPVMSLWPATDPGDALISNGLSTMGFALPAAIGAALLDRARTTIAFTGDGGLLMCLGELRTAAREHLRLRIVVFDDRELSLIRIKQVQRGYHTDGMSMGPIDWTALGTGFGMSAVSAASEASLEAALRDTEDEPGPVLIGAKIDPSEYEHTIRSLRG